MRRRILILLLLVGCQSATPRSTTSPDPSSRDLSVNPAILLTAQEDLRQFTLRGIQFGDDASRIPRAKISSVDEKSGWTVLRDANRYRIKKGLVDGLGIWD